MIISSGWRACANTIKSGTDTDAHLTSALTNFAPATIVVSRELGQADKIVDHIWYENLSLSHGETKAFVLLRRLSVIYG